MNTKSDDQHVQKPIGQNKNSDLKPTRHETKD
jgi:hypothetical protein